MRGSEMPSGRVFMQGWGSKPRLRQRALTKIWIDNAAKLERDISRKLKSLRAQKRAV
jgi:hypothetical protein